MKLAGPPAMMEVLLPTHSPAPMMPPMEIIVRWRPFSERLSYYLVLESAGGAVCTAEFGWVISHPFVILNRILPCFDAGPRIAEFRHGRGPPQLPFPDPGHGICRVRTVEFAGQPMRIP